MEKPWQETDLRKRKVIAVRQLAAWESRARTWELYRANDDEQTPVRCVKCGQSVFFTYDAFGIPYDYTEGELLALTVAHVRQVHAGEFCD